ncbi:MAG: prolipoprotein diacylglyceryl transferase [Bacilli bacterium]
METLALMTIEPLDRVMIWLGPIPVYWYGAIIAAGAALGLFIATKEAQRLGYDKDLMIDLVIWAIPIALVCARAYYVLFEWDYYGQHLDKVFSIREGGIAIHGALIGSALVAYVFARRRHISFWTIADIAAPSLLLGQAIGRWGNFMNQEAFGSEVTRELLESFYLPDWIINNMYINGEYHHPTFLYESVWNIIGVVLLILLRKAPIRRGELFLSYAIYYSIGRFFIEGLRTDSLMLTDTLRMAQVISIATIVVSIMIIAYRRTKMKNEPLYNTMNPQIGVK